MFPNFRGKSMMNSLLAFGILLFTCLVNSSNGQGYIRLSRADPMMSLLLNGKNTQNGMQENNDPYLDQDAYLMKKRAKDGKRNFLNFIFRKYPTDEKGGDIDGRNKRIPPHPIGSHPIIEQHPIVMETYLRPYFDYLEN